jgi:hypothetical protein
MKKTINWITAFAYKNFDKITVKVPVYLNLGILDLPGIIKVGEDYYTLRGTTPVTYYFSTMAECGLADLK